MIKKSELLDAIKLKCAVEKAHAMTQSNHKFLCYECSLSPRHERSHQKGAEAIIDGLAMRYVKLPSTRLRKCLDCGEKKRHGWIPKVCKAWEESNERIRNDHVRR